MYTSHSAVAAGVAAWVWAGRLGERVLVGGRVFVDGHQNGQFLAPNWREVTQQSGIGLLLAVH